MKYPKKQPNMATMSSLTMTANESAKMFNGDQKNMTMLGKKFDESQPIDENTRLLDVLADEFELLGITADVDANGFQEINGLNIATRSINSKAPTSKASKAAPSSNDRPPEQFCTLSAI